MRLFLWFFFLCVVYVESNNIFLNGTRIQKKDILDPDFQKQFFELERDVSEEELMRMYWDNLQSNQKRRQEGLVPILLVPGVGGSILLGSNKHSEGRLRRLWVNAFGAESIAFEGLTSFWDGAKSSISLNTRNEDVVVPQTACGLYAISDLMPGIFLSYRYFEPLINFLQSRGYSACESLFGYPYDWRQNALNPEIQEDLLNKIKKLDEDGGSRGVDIVSHSMGGLVVAAFYATFPEANTLIRSWTTVGTPFQGAGGVSLTAPISGYAFGHPFISKAVAHQISQNFGSGGVLRNNPTFDWDPRGTVKTCLNSEPNPREWHAENIAELWAAVNENNVIEWEREDHRFPFNEQIEEYGEEFRNSVIHRLGEIVQTPFFNVVGTNVPTLSSADYPCVDSYTDLLFKSYTAREDGDGDGDGLVLTQSALATNGLIPTTDPLMLSEIEHMSLIQQQQFFDFLAETLDGLNQ
mmetsp:Transcript_29811/g.41178  ORF Transcript_29811/g.41178 Transcript_29811/m.41178 type:complete len:466 (-) Transcript_29811:83-1480(-)